MGCRKCGNDCFYDRFSFLKNLIIPESENSKSRLFKEVSSCLILDACF